MKVCVLWNLTSVCVCDALTLYWFASALHASVQRSAPVCWSCAGFHWLISLISSCHCRHDKNAQLSVAFDGYDILHTVNSVCGSDIPAVISHEWKLFHGVNCPGLCWSSILTFQFSSFSSADWWKWPYTSHIWKIPAFFTFSLKFTMKLFLLLFL